MKTQKINNYLSKYGMTVYYSAVSRLWHLTLTSGHERALSTDTLRALLKLLESDDLRLRIIINRAVRAQLGVL